MTELTIRQAAPGDWPVVAEMGARIFLRGVDDEAQYQSALQSWLRLVDDPTFSYENSWLGMVNGHIAAHVGYLERVLRYGSVELPVGGVAGVMTRPEFRGRGYAYMLMRAAIDHIKHRGLPLSLLDGIPRFYDRLGYAPLWYGYATYFTVKEAQQVADDEAGYCVRDLTSDDILAVLALHEDEWCARPWQIKRTVGWLRYKLSMSMHKTYVVEDADGTLRGYSSGRVLTNRQEVVVADQAAAAALLRHTAALLDDQPGQKVMWLGLPDTRAARFVRRLCSVELTTWIMHRGGWMGRFIHPQAALDALRPEFIARLHALEIPQAENATFEATADMVTVQLNGLVFDVPQPIFLQLVFGFLAPDDVDNFLGMHVNQTGRELLKRLFPPVVNGLAGLDWF